MGKFLERRLLQRERAREHAGDLQRTDLYTCMRKLLRTGRTTGKKQADQSPELTQG